MEVLSIIGFTLTFVLSIVLMKQRAHRHLGWIFLCCTLIMVEDYLWNSERIIDLPFLVEKFTPLCFLIPPLLFFYFAQAKSFKIKFYGLHFIIPVLPYINFLPLHLGGLSYQLCYAHYELSEAVIPSCADVIASSPVYYNDDILDILFVIQAVIYAIWIIYIIKKKSLKTIKSEKAALSEWENRVLAVMACAMLGTLIGLMFFPEGLSFKTFILPSIGLAVIVALLNNSSLLKIRSRSKSYAGISDKEEHEFFQTMQKYLLDSSVHTRQDLTLSMVAHELNIPANKLSYVIGRKDATFREILNGIRIKKALDFMDNMESNRYSIEGIANNYGFKSRTTFYKCFREKTSMTPSEYMKSKKKYVQ